MILNLILFFFENWNLGWVFLPKPVKNSPNPKFWVRAWFLVEISKSSGFGVEILKGFGFWVQFFKNFLVSGAIFWIWVRSKIEP